MERITTIQLKSLILYFLKDSKNITLKDEIDYVYEALYSPNKEIEQLNSKHHISSNEYEIRDRLGNVMKEFNVRFSQIKISDYDKALMIVLNDISEKSRIKEAKLSEKLKTVMLCSISHELRSPANQINGVLSLLKPTLTSVHQLNLYRIATSSTEILWTKINDLLDYWEIETNTFKLNIIPFSPRKQLSSLEELFVPLIDSNNIKIYFFLQENIPSLISHDMRRISQIMVNLLSNAIKYTKKGIILVKIDWEFADQNDKVSLGKVRYTVSDSGWGIPKDRRINLFKLLDPSIFKENSFRI